MEDETRSTYHHQQHQHNQRPSNSELMSSAKLIADAARSAFAHETDKVDKARVAGAAADLLDAAKSYGNLEEKSFGKYVDKAEDYLHQYHHSHSSTTAAAPHSSHHSAASAAHHEASYDSGESEAHSTSAGSGGGGSGGGYEDYLKLAQGFLKKH
ncbi:hypothetical protein Nepgr_003617 [Nepenthes gracilis]|uniref:Nodulin-related protein 1 n=1 Tax=Nepenthes gracilis TaxID=150966 RepID=A0AAD3RZU3_NEPGR|nr:hypothetical protein Nepgr_003617 [Nepenthes gracilis]